MQSKTASEANATVRMNDIIDYMRKMEQEEITLVGEQSLLPFFHGIIGGGSVLYMPAAYLVFEKALNGGIATGVVSCFASMTEHNMDTSPTCIGHDTRHGYQRRLPNVLSLMI